MSRVDRKGFTLVELLLAMAFISVLLLAIAMTVIQISHIYNRGITLKEVNQVGRTMSDELERGIAASESFSILPADKRYIVESWGGRLCLGRTSYIWNYGKQLAAGDANVSKYTTTNDQIRLVKVPDVGANYCSGAANFQRINPVGAEELLKTGDRTLALHQFKIESGTNAKDAATGQQLYTLTFAIGTSDFAALSNDTLSCRPPNEQGSDLAYCSVQQFKLVLRAGNKVN